MSYIFNFQKSAFYFIIIISLFSISNASAQCYFTLTGDTTASKSCKYALENVVWTNLSGTAAAQNDIIKIGGTNNWDADAISANKVYNNGFMQTIVVETNTNRMIGLNSVNSNTSYTDLEYAFYLQSNGSLTIYENGSNKGTLGYYSAGDTLRISVMNNVVFYLQNSNIIYTSTSTPTLPMFVDMSINTVNGTLQDVVIGNGTETLFTVFEANPGASPTYQWKLNGGNVGSGTTTYTNNLSDGDQLECVLTPSLGGCAGSSVVSNTINIKTLPIDFDIQAYITNDSIQDGSCLFVNEDIRWQSLSGAYENGTNNIIKTGGTNAWNTGGFSQNKVENGGFMQTVVNETNTNRMIGLNSTNANVNYNDIEYAFYLQSNGSLTIYENGSNRGTWGSYTTGDTLQVAVVDNEVRYIQNGSVVYTSLTAPSLPLYVDMSLNTVGATLENITINNTGYGRFYASVIGLSNVNYQWKLNGLNVGSNSSIYTNTGVTTGDSITCLFSINGTQDCGGATSFSSNIITIEDNTPTKNVIFSVRNDSIITPSCKYAYEEVSWQTISGLTLTSGTNNIQKVDGTNAWNTGGFSYNKVEDGGFMQTIVNETNTHRMIGLNASNANVSYSDIDYAFFLQANGSLTIYENGSNKGTWGAYSTGDTLRISVVDNEVRYIQNGNIVYTSLVAPSLPLYVDVSLNTVGATLENIYVNNTTYGVYTAFVSGFSDVGYQWKLNGINVGSDSPVYTNTTTTANDTIYCELTLKNTIGCSADTIMTSNRIMINEQSLTNNVLFSIRNDSIIQNSCLFANEDVAWQSLSGLTLNGSNNVTKTSGTNSWNVGGFSYNKVENGGFMQTVVNETNTSRMIGLNASNSNVSYSDIDYAFFLVSSGGLSIYENGSNKGSWGAYSTGDTLRIAVIDNEVLYMQNGNVIYTSSNAPSLPLYVDMSLNTVGATLENITVYNGMYGNFSAFVSGATAVSYQWKLNGGNVGSDSPNYSNTSLNDGDVISCVLSIIGTSGCSDTTVTSNIINIKEEPFDDFVSFYITKENTERNGCQFAIEDVVWQSAGGLDKNGNSISKSVGTNSWNTGAFSFNKINTNGYMQFTVTETNKNRMIGLNSVNTNVSYTDIEYAFYLQSNGSLTIYENGSNKGSYGTYTTNDVLRINVSGNTVEYLKNGTIIYTSSVVPSPPLYVDASLNTIGSSISNVQIASATHGNFRASGTNLGTSPSYQWQLNGVNVGANLPTYSNDTLKENDVITCTVTADYQNCSATAINSNEITITDMVPENFTPSFTPTNTTWLGTSTAWFDPSNWSAGVPRSGTNAIIPNGVGNYPTIPNNAYLYGLDIGSSASLTLSGNAHLSIYNEWTNAGTFTTNTALVEFKTCVDTSKWNSTTPIDIYDVKVNNKKGLLIDNGNMTIIDSLIFVDGIIYNDVNEIIFTDGAKWTGASVSSHIDGEAIKVGNNAFTFPLGNAGYYNPIGISAPSVITDEFKARFHRAEPINRYVIDPSLDHISSVDYWDLERVTGSSSLMVTLYWNSVDHYITDLNDLVVSHYDGGTSEWENMGGLAAGGASAGSIISTVVFNTFSPITFGSIAGVNPLPIDLISFDGKLNEDQVDLTWITSSEINNDYFTIERSKDGFEWEVINKIKGAGNSNTTLKYVYIDKNPLKGISYYRLKQTDFNGDYSYSETVTVQLVNKEDILIYPNPVKDYLTISNLCEGCNISVYSALGELVFSGSQQKINTETWNKGVYQIVVIDNDGIIKNSTIIK
ncbi:MAG: T9SS type A sorting domain-containing protein [Flavobacteriales bacterium]|nr:T9SS type A sorting domain-containing protein [Flavobacteriales bacterium]